MNTRHLNSAFCILAALILFTPACEREFDNPWDGKATTDPNAWAPQNLQITNVSITEKKLTWEYNGDDRFEGFKIDRKVGNGEWRMAYFICNKETRSWSDTLIIPDSIITYHYNLYAFAGQYNSNSISDTTYSFIPAPSNLQIEKPNNKIYKLTWNDNSNGEEGFKIDRKVDAYDWQIAYGVVLANQTSFIDTNVFNKSHLSLNIEYRVYSFLKSSESLKALITTTAYLSAPTDFNIIPNSITSVTLTWQDNSNGEEGFNIDRKDEGGNWEPLITLPANCSSFVDSTLLLNTIIYYRISAFFGQYNSSFTEENFNSDIPPPTNLQLTQNPINSVTLTWQDNSNGEEGFKVDRKVNEGDWDYEYAILNANQISFTDNGLDLLSNIYTYRLYAYFQGFISQVVESPMTTIFCGYPFIDSRDENQYQTVQIGGQCWMKENLAWLPVVSPPSSGSQTSPYYYVYGYQGTSVSAAKATSNYQTYGVLYNWQAALTACPTGWHLPSDAGWTTLTTFLGGESVAGGKMKEAGTAHWNSPNTDATNSSGFTGLPGGYRTNNGYFIAIGGSGYWWSSDESSGVSAWSRKLNYTSAAVTKLATYNEYGFSVRCLRDE